MINTTDLQYPLLVLITCPTDLQNNNPWCGTINRAKRTVAHISKRLRINSTHVPPATFPLAAYGLAETHHLPTLLFLTPESAGFYLAADPSANPPANDLEWSVRIEAFIGDCLSQSQHIKRDATKQSYAQTTLVRSASPPPPSPIWTGPTKPIVSTARTLEADLAAAHHCGLLLVHDARMDDASSSSASAASSTGSNRNWAAPTTRWEALSDHLFERFAPETAIDRASMRLLQFDVSRNDLPGTPLGRQLGFALSRTGLPAFVRVAPSSEQPDQPASFASVPARRVRASSALLNWALAHAQSCHRGHLEREVEVQTRQIDAIEQRIRELQEGSASAEDGELAASSARTATSSPTTTSWMDGFLENGLPEFTSSLRYEIRRRAAERIRKRASEIANEASNVHERFQVSYSTRISQVDAKSGGSSEEVPSLLAANGWAQEKQGAIGEALAAATASASTIMRSLDAVGGGGEASLVMMQEAETKAQVELDRAERLVMGLRSLIDSGLALAVGAK